MNSRLTPASERSPFYATTISLSGMLLCVFTTLAVLFSASRDQSGAALSVVTNSFNKSLQDLGRNDVAIIAASFRKAASAPDENRSGTSRSALKSARSIDRNVHAPAASEEEEQGQFPDETLRPTDVNGPVFLHLMTELQRYCHVSRAQNLGGQLALDLHSQIPQSQDSVRNAVERILKTCRNDTRSAGQSPAEFEVIVWASTPATDALAAASQEAFAFEQSLQKSLKAQSTAEIVIRSSGRIWTRPNSPRPLTTVIVRSAKR